MSQQSSFQKYLNEEVQKVRNVYYPIRAGLLRRTLVRRAACRHLHPNPDDEFCKPEVGPNYGIISDYEKAFRHGTDFQPLSDNERDRVKPEPLIVQRTSPDGYQILNGHHRWAAAFRMGIKRVKVKVVNLTQEKDIRNMMEKVRSDKRAVLDLDEVVFRSPDEPLLEKPLPFPANRIYKERIRLGIPALLHCLKRNGYEIWVYTSKYYSIEYIRWFFRHWNVRLTGIVTGSGRKSAGWSETGKTLTKLSEAKYHSTLHVANDALVRSFTGSKEFEEYPLDPSSEQWARQAMDAIEKMKS